MAELKAPATSGTRNVRLAELLGALSYALDLTEGQPEGHCIRCCWIGMHVGRELGLSGRQMWEIYYTTMLKDLGCSSNAARICQLYLTDDRAFKHDFKTIGTGTFNAVKFVFEHTGLKEPFAKKLRTAIKVMANSGEYSVELIETRCQAGAGIARKLRFPEPVAQGIQYLDEHWDGSGLPSQAQGDDIPVQAQIALLAQVVDVFHTANGKDAAIGEIAARSGSWFDPVLAAAFSRVALKDGFWDSLKNKNLKQKVLSLEPAQAKAELDDDYIDDIALGFATVIDAKSPYTAGHSERVQLYTDLVAREMGIGPEKRRWLRRAALLHDIGKLGISNSILDKPKKLTEAEYDEIRKHPAFSEIILSRAGIFADIAKIAGAHHERLDGTGYPRGLKGDQITRDMRILTVADVFDAMTSSRPYWHARAPEHALELMEREIGTAFDPDCFAALVRALDKARSKAAA